MNTMKGFLTNTTRSVAWMKKTFSDGNLELRPPFQRKPVWTDKQKSYLIDTILRGLPIPELYIQTAVNSAGIERFMVVDGQQRVRTVLDFLAGNFELDPEEVPNYGDYSFDDLDEKDKQRFYSYDFLVRVLPDIEEEQLRAIFQRLNRNVVALNRQELRHATYWGPFIKTMEKLSDEPYWLGTGIFSANDVRRMIDVEFISELAILLLHGPQNKKLSLEDWYVSYESEFDQRSALEDKFLRITNELDAIIPDIKRTRWKKKSDFYSLFGVLGDNASRLPLSKTARNTIRKKLLTFGEQVNKYLSKEGRGAYSPNVRKYATAVERAASDLGNRKTRAEILSGLLASSFK